ncbi:MAG: hypothetical protein CVV49_03505 [Spirochaetae bacterium HGW-Spirochaetae-5]|nr:MAG: hypothetical protein CVV49_03505 [Spirochaetae bacterium HGW-Spirochaetae-5]
MLDNFYENLKKNIFEVKEYNKISIFTISTTSKQEDEPYLTPIRYSKDFSAFGCVIFNQSIILNIIEIMDGQVDIILVDGEKKIPLTIYRDIDEVNNVFYKTRKTIGLVETGNLSKICFMYVKKSKIYEYKPNDLTVNATWMFLSHRFKELSGKKITVLGVGNIGSKLSLKLVECGAQVHIHRTNSFVGHLIEQGLNCIKPQNTVSKIEFHQNPLQASFMSEIVIGASNGVQVINVDIVKSLSRNCLIVDLGKNNITPDAIDYATSQGIEIYRSDITSAFEGYIYEILKMENILCSSYGKKDLGFCTVVGGGYFGSDGDIVVDKIISPEVVIGVAAGDGSIKKNLNEEDKKRLERLMKEFNIETVW